MVVHVDNTYCPTKEFETYQTPYGNPFSEEVKGLLGKRVERMFYSQAVLKQSNPSTITDALLGAKGNWGFYIALTLCELTPDEKRVIKCEDITEISKFPWDLKTTESGRKPIGKKGGIKLFEDDRYLIGIEDSDDVHVYIFKK